MQSGRPARLSGIPDLGLIRVGPLVTHIVPYGLIRIGPLVTNRSVNSDVLQRTTLRLALTKSGKSLATP